LVEEIRLRMACWFLTWIGSILNLGTELFWAGTWPTERQKEQNSNSLETTFNNRPSVSVVKNDGWLGFVICHD
jgi:hypothetical protein